MNFSTTTVFFNVSSASDSRKKDFPISAEKVDRNFDRGSRKISIVLFYMAISPLVKKSLIESSDEKNLDDYIRTTCRSLRVNKLNIQAHSKHR